MSNAGAVSNKKLHLADICDGLGLKPVIPVSGTGNRAVLRVVQRELPPQMDIVCKDGERTSHLTKLAGTLISQRRPLEEVVSLAQEWNDRNTPPLDAEKVASTCDGIWKTHQRNHPAPEVVEDALFDIEQARISRLLASDPPPRRWLLKDCLLCGKVGAIVAPGGTGKSQVLLQLGASVATGLTFLGHWEVPEPGGVLMLMAEDDEEEIHHRLRNLHTQLFLSGRDDLNLSQRLEQRLFIRSMVGEHNLMTAKSLNGETLSTGYAQRLVNTATQIPDLRLVIVDPASRFRGGIENSAEDTTRFIEELEVVRKHTGATVLVAHHTNKGSSNATEASQNASRGSSAFSDGVRWQMNLVTLTAKEAKDLGVAEERRHFYLAAQVVKNNYAAPSEGILLERREGGYLEKVDPDLVSRATQGNLLYQVQQVLRTEAEEGRYYTRSAFEEAFGGVERRLKIGIIYLRDRLNRWVAEGRLFLDDKKKLKADSPIVSGYPPLSDKSANKTKG